VETYHRKRKDQLRDAWEVGENNWKKVFLDKIWDFTQIGSGEFLKTKQS
jgi:hypothetical protein